MDSLVILVQVPGMAYAVSEARYLACFINCLTYLSKQQTESHIRAGAWSKRRQDSFFINVNGQTFGWYPSFIVYCVG